MSSKYESLSGAVDQKFSEYDTPPAEPMELAQKWISSAVEAGVREPLALALATSDRQGHTSNRMVAVINVSDEGLLFTSHRTSQKGRQIAETGWASGLLYWRETAQQLIISGSVATLPDDEAERLWNARPAPLHAMSTASRQSDPIEDIGALEAEAERLAAVGAPLPRPARFAGYLLQPTVVEFWSADAGRAHRRLRYDRAAEGWQISRLQP
jgi:pyridoxamine 5'-phosphate oxidase